MAARTLGSMRLKLSKTLWGVPEAGWIAYDPKVRFIMLGLR